MINETLIKEFLHTVKCADIIDFIERGKIPVLDFYLV